MVILKVSVMIQGLAIVALAYALGVLRRRVEKLERR